MSADDEADFLWLMKIPDHVRSATTSHADTGSCDWLVLTSSSGRSQRQRQQQQQQALTFVTSSSLPYDPVHKSCNLATYKPPVAGDAISSEAASGQRRLVRLSTQNETEHSA